MAGSYSLTASSLTVSSVVMKICFLVSFVMLIHLGRSCCKQLEFASCLYLSKCRPPWDPGISVLSEISERKDHPLCSLQPPLFQDWCI